MPGLKMYLFSYELRGEDNTEFVWDCEAASWNEAREIKEMVYPEAKVLSKERFEIEDK